MGYIAGGLLAFGLIAVGPSLADEAPKKLSVIVNPDWLKKPTADQIVAAWPRGALQRGERGRAVIDCRVNIQGLAEDCHVNSETPAGVGFGAAALSLTPQFQFRAATRDGAPFPARINVPITFETPQPSRGSSDLYTDLTLVRAPVWTQAPRYADVGAAYPKSGGGQAGYVAFRCEVKGDETLKNCNAIHESPTGHGFESSARGLLKLFRLDLTGAAPKAGHQLMVDVPIRLISPNSPEFTDRKVAQPTWLTAVDPKSASLFPAQAANAGFRTGRGVADCAIATDGSLTDCTPGVADPPGLGFSEFAVAIAKVMRMNRWSDGGGPVDGARIKLPVRFNLKATAASAGGA